MSSLAHGFEDREAAAQQLADRLKAYQGKNPLILAIPRGAVPMGRIIAERLGGQLDVVLVRKVASPFNPEFALGAVDEDGNLFMNPYHGMSGAEAAEIAREKERQMAVIKARRASYLPQQAQIDPAGRIVIVVDDGIATGATMIAALKSVRAKKPKKLICATPVGAPDSIRSVTDYADQVVCLQEPEYFMAVGQFYRYFPQVSDEEVTQELAAAAAARNP